MTAPEIAIPERDGKTAKMYRYVYLLIFMANLSFSGGKICMTDHFQPLWAQNVPRFGIAHALALGVS
jgi:ufm1-conjugating enzyme 1